MALRSKLFTKDPAVRDRLERCRLHNSDHILFGAKGDHVSAIQAALFIILPNLKLPDNELSDKATGKGFYGPKTAAAVRLYKQTHKPPIINKTYQSAPDDIVGIMTIQALDDDLVKREPGPRPPVPPPRPAPLQIVPFHEATPMLIAQHPHNLAKSDLEDTPSTPTSLIAKAQLLRKRGDTTANLETDMRVELTLGGGPAGIEVLNAFVANLAAKTTITFGVGSKLASLVQASSKFKDANNEVKTFVTDALTESAATGILDYEVLRESGHKVPPPLFGFGGLDPLHFVIGSFQGSKVFLEDFSADATTRTYRAVLIYEFFDHFGADDDDLVPDTHGHGSPGQVALWLLQRERHPGHEPFVLKVVMEETITDRF